MIRWIVHECCTFLPNVGKYSSDTLSDSNRLESSVTNSQSSQKCYVSILGTIATFHCLWNASVETQPASSVRLICCRKWGQQNRVPKCEQVNMSVSADFNSEQFSPKIVRIKALLTFNSPIHHMKMAAMKIETVTACDNPS